MELNSIYKSGIIKLAALLGLLCFLIGLTKYLPKTSPNFIVNKQAQCFVENQQALLAAARDKNKPVYYVNSLNDYYGYQLGLSTNQLDKLYEYRKKAGKIYSLSVFQEITDMTNEQLDTIKKSLVFAKKRKVYSPYKENAATVKKVNSNKSLYDINTITAQELEEVLRFSKFMSNRIVKFRRYLKEFRSMEQLQDVYGIKPDQLKLLNEKCILSQTSFEKKKIHNLSRYELSRVPYLNKELSQQIINFIENNGELTSFTDLEEIEDFPTDKIARLPLYLTLEK